MITIIAEKKEQAKQYLAAFKVLGATGIKANPSDYQLYDSRVLKDTVSITWTYGHLLQTKLPEEINPEWTFTAVDKLPFFPERLSLKVDANPERKKLFKQIQSLVKQSQMVILGGDADREGALIQIQLAQYLGLFESGKLIKRLMINETGPEEVARHIQELQNLDYTFKQYRGALARQYLDWIVGMNLSVIYTFRLNELGYDFGSAFPVGRVKSVALSMINKRNEEIEQFIPERFYRGIGQFSSDVGTYKGRLIVPAEEKKQGFDGRFFIKDGGLDEARAYYPVSKSRDEPLIGTVSEIIPTERFEQSEALFTTRKLQNAMEFLISDGTETLSIAEELYNEGYLTYPRTNTPLISEGLFERIRAKLPYFQALLGDQSTPTQLRPRERYVNTKEIRQKAHEAITVTDKVPDIDVVVNWSPKKKALYTVVLERCVAMYLSDYQYLENKIITTVGSLDFQTIKKEVIEPGFKVLYGTEEPTEADDNQGKRQELRVGDKVEANFIFKEGVTHAKPKFTLISILNALALAGQEDEASSFVLAVSEGLGTEATRAEIIKDMLAKEIIVLNKKMLELTPKGKVLVAALKQEPLLCKPLLTAKWEEAIQKVEEGRLALPILLKQNEAFVRQAIEKAKRITRQQLPKIDNSWGVCPQCGGELHKGKWDLKCQEGCGFHLKIEMAHKKLSDVQLRTLIETRRTKPIKGFKGKNDKFEGIVILDDDNKAVFEYLPSSKKKK